MMKSKFLLMLIGVIGAGCGAEKPTHEVRSERTARAEITANEIDMFEQTIEKEASISKVNENQEALDLDVFNLSGSDASCSKNRDTVHYLAWKFRSKLKCLFRTTASGTKMRTEAFGKGQLQLCKNTFSAYRKALTNHQLSRSCRQNYPLNMRYLNWVARPVKGYSLY